MSSARDHAVSFEAVKVAMRQTKDGYAMTLVIHPDDVPPDLFATPVGQRYGVALVALGDDEQPLETRVSEHVIQRARDDGDAAVQYAAMLCKEPLFWDFLNKHIDFGIPKVVDEKSAVSALHQWLGIGTRAEIRTRFSVREQFDAVARSYRSWAGIT